MTLLSAFGGGLFIIPVGLFLAGLWSFYRGFIQWKSGSGWWGTDERGVSKWFESDDKIPYWSVGANVFGVLFIAFSIGAAVWMWLEK